MMNHPSQINVDFDFIIASRKIFTQPSEFSSSIQSLSMLPAMPEA